MRWGVCVHIIFPESTEKAKCSGWIMTTLQGDAVYPGEDWEPSTSWKLSTEGGAADVVTAAALWAVPPGTTGYTQVSVGSAAAELVERKGNGKIQNKELTEAEVCVLHSHQWVVVTVLLSEPFAVHFPRWDNRVMAGSPARGEPGQPAVS